jgi:hypothetical protein
VAQASKLVFITRQPSQNKQPEQQNASGDVLDPQPDPPHSPTMSKKPTCDLVMPFFSRSMRGDTLKELAFSRSPCACIWGNLRKAFTRGMMCREDHQQLVVLVQMVHAECSCAQSLQQVSQSWSAPVFPALPVVPCLLTITHPPTCLKNSSSK